MLDVIYIFLCIFLFNTSNERERERERESRMITKGVSMFTVPKNIILAFLSTLRILVEKYY